MKQLSIFTLLLSGLFSKAQTPITLNRSDFPCPSTATCGLPDSILFTNVPLSVNSVNTIPTGANTTWNTLPLQNGTTAYQNFFSMSATPFVFQLVFLSCDYAQPLLGGNVVGTLPVTDAYEYYNYAGPGSSRLEIKGFGAYVTIPGQTTAIPLPAIYSSPDIVYQFPIMFGNKDSSNSGYSLTIPLGGIIGDITFKRNQKRVNEVDGWGSVITPAGTFEVLRVKSSITRVDSLITGLFPIGFPSKPVEYKWLGQNKKIPVLQVNGNQTAGNFNPSSITYWGQAPLAVTSMNDLQSLDLYPNPVMSESRFTYTLPKESDVDIFITDISGKMTGRFHFKKQSAGPHTEVLPFTTLAPGTYLLKCISENRVISGKVIKF